MSARHINLLKQHLSTKYFPLIDVSDVSNKPADQVENFKLTRALAAYCIKNESGCTIQEATSAVTDGTDDNGIDAVFVDQRNPAQPKLILVQTKWNHAGNKSPSRDDVRTFIDGIEDILASNWGNFNSKLNTHKTSISKALENVGCRVVSILAYTSQQDIGSHGASKITKFLTENNEAGEFLDFNILKLNSLFQTLSAGGSSEKINLSITLNHWGSIDEPIYSVYGRVDAEQISDWWQTHKERLFSKNIRGILGDTKVNKEIADTIKNKPDHFWYFNNGITLIAKSVVKSAAGGRKKDVGTFVCDDISIVNGAQTVQTIGRYFADAQTPPEGCEVQIRLIQNDGSDAAFGQQVTQANNRQNAVEGRDFAALDDEQQRLRTELAILDISYQLTRSSNYISSENSFDVEEALVALACSSMDPDLAIAAKREIGRFWARLDAPPYRTLINTATTGSQVKNSVLFQRAIDKEIESNKSSQTPRNQTIITWANRLISSLVFKKLGPNRIADGSTDPTSQAELSELQTHTKDAINAIIKATDTDFPTAYPAVLFRNPSKSKTVFQSAEKLI